MKPDNLPPLPAAPKLDPERLAAVLIAGHLAALDAGTQNPEDGGTCNTDRLMIRLDKWTPDMIEATNRNTPPGVAVGPRWTSGIHKGFRPVNIGQKGQGNRRTRMVEAAHRAIRDAAPDLAHLFTVDYCID
jgi:hypothetical protein